MRGTWISERNLRVAKEAVKKARISLQGAEPWLNGDDMLLVQRVWDRSALEAYTEHVGQVEDTLVGLLALCEEVIP